VSTFWVRRTATYVLGLGLMGSIASCAQVSQPTTQSKRVNEMTSKDTISASARAELDASLRAIVNAPGRELSSLAAVVIRDGRIVYSTALGRRFIDVASGNQHRDANVDSLYRIASISKMMVALGVVKLVDEGKLDLDRDISEYFGYSVRNPNFPDAKITLRMLMSHTSSLRDAGGYNFPESVNLREVLVPGGARYGSGAMWAKDRAPGGYFNYCNFGWGLVATAMERATGERFDRLMQRVLFAPMGVTATFDPASLAPSELAKVATLYRKRTEVNGKEVWNTAGPWVAQVDDYSKDAPKPRGSEAYAIGSNGSVYGPQGGLRISANDLAKIMLMLMNDGVHEGRVVLSKRAVELLKSEQWRYDKTAFSGKGNRAEDDEGEGGLFNAFALGPQIFLDISNGRTGDRVVEGGGFTGYGHLGNAYGLTSAFIFDPKTKNGMIFLVGGIAADPETDRGAYSAFYRYEERIMTALHRGAFLQSSQRQ
jgi:CubicO group peptidase (beta-lactamase class C family)